MKKLLSLVLAVMMLLGCMSVTALAYENVRGDESTINSLTLAVGDVISVTKDLRDEEDKVTNLRFYNLNPTWAYGDTERVFTGSVPDSYCISLEYPSCPSTGVLLVTKAWDETDKTIELAFYASEEDIPAAPSGKSGNTDITLTVAKALTYDMVIPEDVTNLNAVGIYSVGQAKVENVENATDKTVISYTAETTAFKCEGKTDIPASYYTDLQGTNTFPTTAVEVYKSKADAASIPTMYVGISETDWNAAENGTYTATVTFNFSSEEVEAPAAVTAADALTTGAQYKLKYNGNGTDNSLTYAKTETGFELIEFLKNSSDVTAVDGIMCSSSADGSNICFTFAAVNFTLDTSTNKYTFTGPTVYIYTFSSFSVKPAGATEFTEISLTKAE